MGNRPYISGLADQQEDFLVVQSTHGATLRLHRVLHREPLLDEAYTVTSYCKNDERRQIHPLQAFKHSVT